jgi:hypothetical protein
LDAQGLSPFLSTAITIAVALAVFGFLGMRTFQTSRESWLRSVPYKQGRAWNYDQRKLALVFLAWTPLYALMCTVYALVKNPGVSFGIFLALGAGILVIGFLIWCALMGWLYLVRRHRPGDPPRDLVENHPGGGRHHHVHTTLDDS